MHFWSFLLHGAPRARCIRNIVGVQRVIRSLTGLAHWKSRRMQQDPQKHGALPSAMPVRLADARMVSVILQHSVSLAGFEVHSTVRDCMRFEELLFSSSFAMAGRQFTQGPGCGGRPRSHPWGTRQDFKPFSFRGRFETHITCTKPLKAGRLGWWARWLEVSRRKNRLRGHGAQRLSLTWREFEAFLDLSSDVGVSHEALWNRILPFRGAAGSRRYWEP